MISMMYKNNCIYYLTCIWKELAFITISIYGVAAANKGCRRTRVGKEYNGTKSTTKSGRTCQAWSQTPHGHKINDSVNFPDETLEEAANYCRNPDDEPNGPWCYTMDPEKLWEYCNVTYCDQQGKCKCKQYF